MKFSPIRVLNVELWGQAVGRLAWRDRVTYFEYAPQFIASN
jgi:hypothetical protein